MSLVISESMLGKIGAKLAEAYPEEGCGIMIGLSPKEFGDPARELKVNRYHPLSNSWEGPGKKTRYEFSGLELAKVERELSGTGDAILGFYHSHPDVPAWPSPFDLERAWPFYCYLIVSLREGKPAGARAWRVNEDGSSFLEEPVQIIPLP